MHITMKLVSVILCVLPILMSSSGQTDDNEKNCGWRQTTPFRGSYFKLSAKENLTPVVTNDVERRIVCLTEIVVTNNYHYYEIELTSHNMSKKHACEELSDHVYIYDSTDVDRSHAQCISQFGKIVVQLPIYIVYISDVLENGGFDLELRKVDSPCLQDNKITATEMESALYSPLFLSNIVREDIQCDVHITVPLNMALFLQVERTSTISGSSCNGSVAITELDHLGQKELCGSGLESMALVPLNYRSGIRFRMKRERGKYFSGFQLGYRAIQKHTVDCPAAPDIEVNKGSVYIAVHTTSTGSHSCQFHLKANGRTLSLKTLMKDSWHEALTIEVVTGDDDFQPNCPDLPPFKHIQAPPGQDIKVRICYKATNKLTRGDALIGFSAHAADSFPRVFYIANDLKTSLWIPKATIPDSEPQRDFLLVAPYDDSCVKYETESDGPHVSGVAHIYAGSRSDFFEITRDCNDREFNGRVLHSSTSRLIRVEIKRDIRQGFWLSFQVNSTFNGSPFYDGCPVGTTFSTVIKHLSTWKRNTICKWSIGVSTYQIVEFRGFVESPDSVQLVVKHGYNQNLISSVYTSRYLRSPSPYYYSQSDIEVYTKIVSDPPSFTAFSFEYSRLSMSDIEECSTRTLLTTSKLVKSPNYPNYSFKDGHCTWVILPRQSQRVIVHFRFVKIIPCKYNSYIQITMVNGIVAQPCGLYEYTRHYTGKVDISLFTQASQQIAGFYFNVTFQNEGNECSGTIELIADDTERSLTSLNYPSNYPPGLDCRWVIKTELNTRIEIVVKEFFIEGSYDCTADYLSIYDGPSDRYPELATLCGTDFHKVFFSSSTNILLHFHTDHEINNKGFSLTYQKADCGNVPKSLIAETTPKVITSMGYPFSYQGDMHCEWLIESSSNFVEVTIKDIDLEHNRNCRYDYIQIFDGESSQFTSTLGKFCKESDQGSTVTSSGKYLHIEFKTDDNFQGKGFQLSYRSLEKSTSDCGNVPKSLIAETTPKVITSMGYPYSYEGDMHCEWVIESSSNFVEVTIKDIDLEFNQNCSYDYIQIFDGAISQSTPTLGKFCKESDRGRTVTSSGKYLHIEFKTDGLFHGKGFQLSYRSPEKSTSVSSDPVSSSRTGAIVGGCVSFVLVVFFVMIAVVCLLRRKRQQQTSQRHHSNRANTPNYNASFQNNGQSASVFVINPLIVNNRGSMDPPPYPGLTNSAFSPDSNNDYERPPDYHEVANTYHTVLPPAYSPDMPGGPLSPRPSSYDNADRIHPTSETEPNADNGYVNHSSLPGGESQAPSQHHLDSGNHAVEQPDSNYYTASDSHHYAEFEDEEPPLYDLAGPVPSSSRYEPPPVYTPNEGGSNNTRRNNNNNNNRLGPF